MPTQAEFEAAVAQAQPEAKALGLRLSTESMWHPLLASRMVMMASFSPGHCRIGYSPFTPGRSFTWLFPPLSAHNSAVWLGGLVRHELAHCADPRANGMHATGRHATGNAALASPAGCAREREAYADLAFAIHVDGHSTDSTALIATFAQLRSSMAARDPERDTAAVLRCYLQHPAREHRQAGLGQAWPTVLAAWQERCPLTPTATAAVAAP